MTTKVIRLRSDSDIPEWSAALAQCVLHDIYHTPEYHLAARDQGMGEPVMLVVSESTELVAFPLLIREIDSRLSGAKVLHDATSVYGYGGPVTTVTNSADRSHLTTAVSNQLTSMMHDLGLVSVFTRLHPLVETQWVIDPIGQTDKVGPTVVIDLSQPEEMQLRGMRKNLRRTIKKASALGVTVVEDDNWENIHEFEQAYAQTMQRVSAKTSYCFDSAYFAGLRDRLGNKLKLFHAVFDNTIVGSAMFFVHNGIIQYHLGATADGNSQYSPTPIMLNHARIWARENGCQWFHLGGGVEGAEDSVFRFKCGFSKERLEYLASRIVVDQRTYDELCEQRRKLRGDSSDSAADTRFFPEYRAALPLADG